MILKIIKGLNYSLFFIWTLVLLSCSGCKLAFQSQKSLVATNPNRPPILKLSQSSVNLSSNQIISPIVFVNSGGTITQCMISPSLPNGLVIGVSGNNCIISGTPTISTSVNNYTVTAKSKLGTSGAVDFNLQVTPTVQMINMVSGTYSVNQNIDFTVNFSENVNVTGTPTLSILIGQYLSTQVYRNATYLSGSGTNQLIFRYHPQWPDYETSSVILNSPIQLNGGNILSSNNSVASSLNFNLLGPSMIFVDTRTLINSLSLVGATYTSGQNIDVSVNFNTAVTVTGTPQLALTIDQYPSGSTTRYASYLSGTGSSTLIFRYTTQSPDYDTNGIVLTSPLSLNGGTINGVSSGAGALLSFTIPDTSQVLIDTRSFINAVTVAAGTYTSGQNIDVSVSFNNAVRVTGSPQLALTIDQYPSGSTTRYASYLSGTGSSTLIFRYTTQSPDYDTNGIVLTSPLSLNGGTINGVSSGAGAILSFTVPSTSNVLIDTRTLINSISLSPGTYTNGQNVDVNVVFNKIVTVTGTPRVNLSVDQYPSGKATRYASYISGSGTTNLLFRYIAQSPDYDSDGVLILSPISLNAGSINDNLSFSAVLSFIPPTASSSYIDAVEHTVQFSATSMGQLILEGSTSNTTSVSIIPAALTNFIVPININYSSTPTSDHNFNQVNLIIPSGATSTNISNFDVFHDGVAKSRQVLKLDLDRGNSQTLLGPNSHFDFSFKDIDGGSETYSQISSGYSHICGITSSGVLKCWGENNYGQLGDGSTTFHLIPTIIDPGVLYASISAGYHYTCGVTTLGVLKCWGENSYGQLGDGSTTSQLTPTIIDSTTTYASISASVSMNIHGSHTCGITTSGILKCWGDNLYGQIGDGTTIDRHSPTVIDPGVIYNKIIAGNSHTCGITNSGILKCWGDNYYGQLGSINIANKFIPNVIDSGVSYSSISASDHTCGITNNSVLKCWGNNSYGQLGGVFGTSTATINVVDIGVTYASISNGISHTCGITTTGALKCWGINSTGELGIGTQAITASIYTIDAGVSYSNVQAGEHTTCGITTSGNLKCWGDNSNGQYGDGTSTQSYAPTIIDSGVTYNNTTSASAHNCALTNAGAVKCWGDNTYGQLGDGTNVPRSSPITVDKGTAYSSISSRNIHTCGITSLGVLKCWGDNNTSELGNASGVHQLTPSITDPGVTYSIVSAGNTHTCAITTTGVLKCWGDNNFGQLGDGTTFQRSTPTIIDYGVTYSYVSSGNSHTCGVTSAGVLKCWGYNAHGELGDGTTTQRNSPTTIDSGVTYSLVSAGDLHNCGITSLGELKCWGNNLYGQLGFGIANSLTFPTTIDTGVSYSKVYSADIHTCGITNAGVLKCWGTNDKGELGDGTLTVQHIRPVVIDSGVTYLNISAGHRHSCGISTSGILKCWGDDSTFQLGQRRNNYNKPYLISW